VPGHEGIVGNETADQMARTGSKNPFIGPEPACGISIGAAKKAVRDWTNRNQKTLGIHYWTQTGKGIYIRTLCQTNEGSVETKQRPGLPTGHCHLKGHLFKLGLTDDPTRERYLQEDESATYILCDCEAIAHL
jgi:hypothetical protein